MIRDFDRLSVERVQQVLYDDGSGILRWRIRMGCRGNIGIVAGTIHEVRCEQRWTIQIDRGKYLRSRLVFVLNTNRWPLPDMVVDHEDKNTLNDKYNNLREITQKQNMETREALRYVGVDFYQGL